MKKLENWLKVLDDNLLTGLLAIFIFLIPLYPKIPLMVVNYTYVAIRAEDFFISLLTGVFLVQLIRRKATISRQFAITFLLFWGAVFISFYVGYYINQTIPIEFNKVAFYHALRRVEYMIVFFIAAGSIRSVKQFKILLYSLFFSLLLVTVYGVGQRFGGFPAIQTMNPEYAKGRILFLTPEARISSTFGGHYDLSAFIVFIMPLLWGAYVAGKGFLSPARILWIDPLHILRGIGRFITSKLNKLKSSGKSLSLLKDMSLTKAEMIGIFIIASGVICLLAQAVKTYEMILFFVLGGILFVSMLIFARFRSLYLFALIVLSIFTLVLTSSRVSYFGLIVATPLFLWTIRRYVLALLAFTMILLMTFTNSALIERFAQTFQIKLFLVNEQTGETHVVQEIKSDKLPAGSQVVLKVNQKKATVEEEALKKHLIYVESLKTSPGPTSGPQFGLKITPVPIADSATFKEFFAWAPDISFSTRLQVEWPRAIGAFKLSPLFGTGPASITDATDNDYLRWLGEFGAVGTGLFLLILFQIGYFIFKRRRLLPEDAQPLVIAPLFSLFGLMINAGYIDIFEASKIAFTFWYTMGLYVGLLSLKEA